ncbi:MAG TPA: hypothetical protein VE035_04050 [Puia sp.]|nr:hypothetical protein [Puia sp.]
MSEQIEVAITNQNRVFVKFLMRHWHSLPRKIWLDLLLYHSKLILLAIYPIASDLFKSEGDKPATQRQLEQVKQDLAAKIQLTVNEFVKPATARINCSICLKPSKHSMHLLTLKAGAKISIINTNHKWANVSFLDPNSDWPVTGWVLKKYLISVKK